MVSREELQQALEDEASIDARQRVGEALAVALGDVGEFLFVSGSIVGPDRKSGSSPFGHGSDREVGLAMVTQVAAELVGAAQELNVGDRLYAAMALVRQLVEAEYLLWAFGSAASEADSWLRSSRDVRRQMWQPRHLRKKSAGRFDVEDYSNHCERGGHPTPEARFLLDGHGHRISKEAVLLEIVQHGINCWDYLAQAISELESLETLGPRIMALQSVEEFHAARDIRSSVDRFPELAIRWSR